MFTFVGVQGGGSITFSSSGNQRQIINSDEDALEAALGLGELAGLTPQDESDPVNNNYDVRHWKLKHFSSKLFKV